MEVFHEELIWSADHSLGLGWPPYCKCGDWESEELTVLDREYVVPEEYKGTHTKEAIRAAMDHLIDRATNFDVDALEKIYHDDFPYDPRYARPYSQNVFKTGIYCTFQKASSRKGKLSWNTWAEWHDFHVLDNSAVSVLTRKHSGMNGEEMLLLCNIELRFEDGRWQVLREQIFLRPLSDS